MNSIEIKIQKLIDRLRISLSYQRHKHQTLYRIYAIGGPSFIVRQNITVPGLLVVKEYLKLSRLPLFSRYFEVHLTDGHFLIFNLDCDDQEVCTYQAQRPEHTVEFKV
jgi:hypothetical protein